MINVCRHLPGLPRDSLGTSSALLPFFGEGSPIYQNRLLKKGTLLLTSPLEDLEEVPEGSSKPVAEASLRSTAVGSWAGGGGHREYRGRKTAQSRRWCTC